MRTIYTLGDGARPGEKVPKPVQVRTGISDGVYTEIADGLKEGDEVIAGENLPTGASAQSAPSNPFGGGRRGF
jgi:HlyD family secretion protein